MPSVNKSIGCNVTECRYHAQTDQFCSLNQIMVTHHDHPATTVECTDCGSFEPQNK